MSRWKRVLSELMSPTRHEFHRRVANFDGPLRVFGDAPRYRVNARGNRSSHVKIARAEEKIDDMGRIFDAF